jgi:glyoxylase-like metal-dependent hydrolase (beta-lactamase superfamily II)
VTGAAVRFAFAVPPEKGAVTEVAPGVLWIRLPLPMALDHVNVYALDDGDGWTIVDTGLDSGRCREAWAAMLAGPLAGRPVRRVVISHHHPDHVGLAGWFLSQGAELIATRTAWLMTRMLTLDVQPLPTPGQMAFWREAGVDAGSLAARANERPFNFADCVAPLPPGYTRIAEGGQVTMGGRVWDIRCGDGHAPEHATFWSRDDALILGGDQLLPSISANIGVYATEPGADPLAEWLATCQRFRPLAREDHLVLPGHKLPYTGLPARLDQMIAEHLAGLDRLRAHLSHPKRATDCYPALFGRPIGPAEQGLALAEAVAHLNHLLYRGAVTRTRDAGGAWLWQSTQQSPSP